ncbi:DUF1007 family protein [Oleomonas cavernae]|uniref:DUF1007 family protein n=1 Tax=Oleomonas cavernae TaxID=2320859 RepID=A0A418WCF9_9PROT|nr:DUF1007 family protein [Oleomonas cavernae]RJF87608.1 DUF1007 family protein [Oleomonas cavernae]
MMRDLKPYLLGLVLWLALPAAPAAAHPHAWIDLKSTVLLDAQGRAVAVVEEWLFDELYSVFVTEELGKAGAKDPAALLGLARRNLGNLREYDYFTQVRVDDAKVAVAEALDVATQMRDGRLWLRFTVPLAAPAVVGGRRFAYSIFDPTYFIAMGHLENSPVQVSGRDDCKATVRPADPDEEDVTLAAALDRKATADVSLGLAFAEWVDVSCP